ncbi:MAG TPA: hypothetical protein VGL19_05095, partial [Polyangiaceae bacterium]
AVTEIPAESPPAPIVPTSLSVADLNAAVKSGTSALEELAAKYPGEPAVLRALARSYWKDKRAPEAMRTVGKVYSLSETAAVDEEVKDWVRSAAQGSSEPAADAAFTLMQSGLGSKGPDWLYELSTARGTPQRTSARAKRVLTRAGVRNRMSPALAVAVDLRGANGCEGKRALLPRAKDHGDSRALAILRPFQATKGCGFLALSDCFSCLHRDGALETAISAIEERGR